MSKRIREILDRLANGERNWIHDQLDGTSMVQENLDAVDESVREAEAEILKWVAEEVIGQNLDYNDKVLPDYISCGDDVMAINAHLFEQRKRLQLDNLESE